MLTHPPLILRAPEPADLDILYAWENDSSLWHLSNTLVPFSRFVLEQYIMNATQDIFTSKQLRLMIDRQQDGAIKTIGTIDLFDFDPAHQRAGIGILVEASERNKGNATLALKMLVDYCFNILHFHQVYCNISMDNEASLNLFKKLNFEVCGLKKDWTRLKGRWADEYCLQLISACP